MQKRNTGKSKINSRSDIQSVSQPRSVGRRRIRGKGILEERKVPPAHKGQTLGGKERDNDSSGGSRVISWKRQTDIFNPEEFSLSDVHIVGLGNIGSQTALALARLGIQWFHLQDHDHVEEHNLSSQSFDTRNLGVLKVAASMEQIRFINPDAEILCFPKMFTGKKDWDQNSIVIIAVDSMKERQKICAEMKKSKKFPKLIIDGRMGGPQVEVYTCTSYKQWEATFHDNPSDDPCSARYICYTSMVIGAFIANQVKRFLKDEPLKKEAIFDMNSYQIIVN